MSSLLWPRLAPTSGAAGVAAAAGRAFFFLAPCLELKWPPLAFLELLGGIESDLREHHDRREHMHITECMRAEPAARAHAHQPRPPPRHDRRRGRALGRPRESAEAQHRVRRC